ncbi:hypothetical protein PsorP6_015528 [Peronosclerospora sorghi]|uniref:Uncharacterized protein n=1 Tax=Peronosclerospora sorghi TaxID=230839 RepID=A0ACC0WNI8_9STRA|nr:hypothetical protein PsorP6_015528 [Peronosclerospora sorghi]
MYGAPDDYTVTVKASSLGLGLLEDFVCTSYVATALWLFDTLKRSATGRWGHLTHMHAALQVATFTVSWLLVFVAIAPVVADLVFVLCRDTRFSFSLLATILREREHLKDAPIRTEEVHTAYFGAAFVVVLATLFSLVRTRTTWADLSLWSPVELVAPASRKQSVSVKTGTEDAARGVQYTAVALEEGSDNEMDDRFRPVRRQSYNHVVQVSTVLLGLLLGPTLLIALRSTCSPLIAYAALNVTLNEFFFRAFEPAPIETTIVESARPWMEKYIDDLEVHTLFGNDSLYRRTTGFRGDLAFNVSIDPANPPNVLIIGVESFRYRDSRYLVGEHDPSNLFKGTNLTITPEFDRWAKRGVALRNIWSSIPTSRSLESLLYAQVPYDSSVQTGITDGKIATKLSGVPQLFIQKGYETFFTTGSSIDFDNWNTFLPTHGYNTVWSVNEMKRIAQRKYNISVVDWNGVERRGLGWGVHDDLSFQILGDLLVEKHQKRKELAAQGKPTQPLFLTHYTISSHEYFDSWPRWFDKVDKPDFSPMWEREEHATRVQNYMTVRYFTDHELGKFMDRMEREGVLNDTIVVIVGDHGQAPENDKPNLEEESCTRIPGAIIAEGRLGDAVGLVIDDVAEQYDLLNTLADITGLPDGGFNQTGVGRSLKRKLVSKTHVVYSNDPMRKMSIVHGHLRLRYDAVTDHVMLHDTDTDFHMLHDLMPKLSRKEQEMWKAWRDDGRRISAYFKARWDGKCLLAVECGL